MSDYSTDRRKALIEQMRAQSEEPRSKFNIVKPKKGFYDEPDTTGVEEDVPSFSMWKIKFFIGVFLFVGFLFLDTTGSSFYKVDSSAIETTIRKTVNTEEVSTFVKEQLSGITGL